mgnify:CR=1 FL=1
MKNTTGTLKGGFLLYVFVITLLIGFWLRTTGLESSSFWLDEVYSHQRASEGDWGELYQTLRDKNHAPLYSAVLLRLWMNLGDGEFFLRFLTAAIGVLNISVVGLLGKEVCDAKLGLLSACLLATSPMHIHYSKEARMYVPTALFASLAVYWLFRAVKNGRWRQWAGYVFTATLSLYTHYYSAFTLIAVNGFVLIGSWQKDDRELTKALLLSNMVIGLLFTPWLPTFWAQLQGNPVSWITPVSWRSFHTTFTRFFIHKAVLEQTYALFACLLVLVLVTGEVAIIRRRHEYPRVWWSYLFVVSGFQGPILIALVVSIFKPFIVDRYFVTTIVLASVALSWSITELSRHRLGLLLSCVLLAGVLTSAYGTGTIQWREDWRQAADYLRDNAEPGDALILGSHLQQAPLDHYYSGPVLQYSLPTNPMCKDETNCRTNVKQAIESLHPQRLWTVRTERFHGDHRLEDYIGRGYLGPQVSCQDFGGFWEAELCLYEVDSCE